jgi:hypothetical protein
MSVALTMGGWDKPGKSKNENSKPSQIARPAPRQKAATA